MHDHHHHDDHEHPGSGSGIRLAFWLNLSFALLEIAGGLWTNSMAILSDAVHDLGDSFALGLSWYLEVVSKKGKDKKYTYGYRRFSLLAALANTIILIVGSVIILVNAIPRLLHPEHSNAQGMALFAVIGILVNGAAVLRLRDNKSLNASVVSWHLLEDVLGWASVLVVSIVLLFWDVHILDPLLSILISMYVFYNVIRNLRRTLALFLQAVPEEYDIAGIETRLLAVDNVQSTHHTHIWSLDGEQHVLTTHLVVRPDAVKSDLVQIKCQVNDIADLMGFEHTTIELEYEDEECRMKGE